MEEDVLSFIKSSEPLFEGTGVEFDEWCKTTNQVFLQVGPLFTWQHAKAIETYLSEYKGYEGVKVSLMREICSKKPKKH